MFGVRRNYKILLANNWSTRINIVRTIVVSTEHAPNNLTAAADCIKLFKEIPGPSSLPFIGPSRHFLPGGDLYKLNRQEMCNELFRIYGPIVKLEQLANQQDIVFLYDADSVSQIYRGEDTSPVRQPLGTLERYRQTYNKQDHIGVLVNGSGCEWKKFRTLANKSMMNPKLVSQAYSAPLGMIAEDAVARFESIRNENDMIPNLDEEIKLWALEATGAVTLGRRLGCLGSGFEDHSHEKRLFSQIQTVFQYIEKVDFNYNSLKYMLLRVLGENKIMNAYKELEEIIFHFVTQNVESLESKNNSEFQSCTIEKILRENKQAALGVAVDSFVAGVDSVSQTVLIVLYFLGANCDKQQKLREEILSGNERKPYLRACMKESSRLIPTTFANGRITTKPHQILGYEIPKGVLVVFPHQAMCLMDSHFPRAREFIPERWLVGKEHPLYYGNSHPFAHRPFGFGVRTCIGQRIAELTMEALLISMIKTFDVKWEGAPPKITPSVVNKMEKPFNFVFKKNNQSKT